MSQDILILGGGPAGLSTALHLCKAAPELAPRILGLEKARYPRHKLCGGALTDAPREPGKSIPGVPPALVRPAPAVTAQLSTGGYVFPVYGPASFGDTFGAPRPGISGGWHPRRGHLRSRADSAPRGGGRRAAHDRVQPDRRLPALAPSR